MIKIICLIIVGAIVCSCKHKVNCDRETKIFLDSWKEKVKSTYRDSRYKATYVIETFSGKKISIAPIQDIIILANYGDSIIKEPNRFETLLITKERDTFECALTSITCDTIVLRSLGFEDDFDYEQMKYVKKKTKKKG